MKEELITDQPSSIGMTQSLRRAREKSHRWNMSQSTFDPIDEELEKKLIERINQTCKRNGKLPTHIAIQLCHEDSLPNLQGTYESDETEIHRTKRNERHIHPQVQRA